MSNIRRRVDLSPKEFAVSNALDEWLIREHGIFESWANADDFIEFLAGQGYLIVSNKEDDEITILRKQFKIAVGALEKIDAYPRSDMWFQHNIYVQEALAEIEKLKND
jgi:hypothetical protein